MTETLHDLTRLAEWACDADDLWLVTAVIQPFKLDALTLALEALPEFGGLTVTECRGFGRGKAADQSESGPSGSSSRGGASDIIDFTKKTRVEAAVAGRDRAMRVARVVATTAHTGRHGDGKVFVTRLAGAVGIRAFDIDADAL